MEVLIQVSSCVPLLKVSLCYHEELSPVKMCFEGSGEHMYHFHFKMYTKGWEFFKLDGVNGSMICYLFHVDIFPFGITRLNLIIT